MRKLALILIVWAVSVYTSTAQTSTEPKPYIEVQGTAELEIVPDEIYMSITLKERPDSKEKYTIEEQEEKLKAAITELKIPLENLVLSNANADYIAVKLKKKDVVSKTQYLLKVVTAEEVARVFNKLYELKIEDAYISKVSHSKIEEYKKTVKVDAMKAAKNKADYLLGAIDQKTGKALIVKEIPYNISENEIAANVVRYGSYSGGLDLYQEDYRLSSDDKSFKSVIEFKKIKLQAAIYAKFEIQ